MAWMKVGDPISETHIIPNADGSINVNVADVNDNFEIFEDTSFVSGDSPADLDVNTSLGRNGTQFMVRNDGAGDFTVAMSNDGSTFGGAHTMKTGESFTLSDVSIDTIRITHVADSAYRVVVI